MKGLVAVLNRCSAAALAALLLAASPAAAQGAKVKVGLMLPYSGTYAALGNAITNGFKLAVTEGGGKLGGREVEFFTVDDESDPAKAPDNASKLIKRDKVDVLVGTVHSGVALAMAKVARDNDTLLIVPNAGAGDLTGPLCAPNLFRTSFTMWQSGYAIGKVALEQKKKTAVTFTWKYAAGEESVGGEESAQCDGLDQGLRHRARLQRRCQQQTARDAAGRQRSDEEDDSAVIFGAPRTIAAHRLLPHSPKTGGGRSDWSP